MTFCSSMTRQSNNRSLKVSWTHHVSTSGNESRQTYTLRRRVHVNHEFPVCESVAQWALGILVMREVEPTEFAIRVVAVDLGTNGRAFY
jgi:hypothetical protein